MRTPEDIIDEQIEMEDRAAAAEAAGNTETAAHWRNMARLLGIVLSVAVVALAASKVDLMN